MTRRDVRMFLAGIVLALSAALAVAWQDARQDRVMIGDLVDNLPSLSGYGGDPEGT